MQILSPQHPSLSSIRYRLSIFNFFGADPEDDCIGYLKTAAARERFATPMAMMREIKMGL